MTNYKSLYTIILVLSSGILHAQQNFTLYPMTRIPQSHFLNPATQPDSKWHFGMPGLNSMYFQYSNGGFNLNQFYSATEPSNGDSVKLNLNKLVNLLSNKNFISFKTEITWLSGGFKLKNHYFSAAVTDKASMRISLPKDLFRLLIDGNGGSNLDETFNLSFKADALYYREYALGYSYNMDDKISIGGRFKILKGLAVLNTNSADFTFHTDPNNYGYTVSSNFEINSASTFQRLIETDSNHTYPEFKPKNQLLSSKNSGVALDLGAKIKVNKKLTLSASILDMGFIHWNDYAVTVKSHDPNAKYQFNGVYFNAQDTTKSFNDYLQNVVDSMTNLFRPDTTETSFNTRLNANFFIGGQYEISKKLLTGALFYGDFYNRRFYPGLTVNLQWKPFSRLHLNFTNTIFNRSYINPGIGGSLNLGACQLYGVMDNFLLPFSVNSLKTFSLRFGMNFTFGWKEEK